MRADELRVLEAMTSQELARCWCILNSWKVPRQFAAFFPANWETFVNKSDFLRPWMTYIKQRIGVKACLREWNRRMTDDEFEAFYGGEFMREAMRK